VKSRSRPACDDVIDAKVPVLKQLVDVFDEKHCSVIATQVVEGPTISSYGVLKAKEVAGTGGRLYEVLDLVEKPKFEDAPSNLAVIGRYILTPTIFETLSDINRARAASYSLRRLAWVAAAREDVRLRL